MKHNIHILLSIIFFTSFTVLKAQDINYTQYEMVPVFINPGNTGGFFGTFRVGGIYRDRAPSIEGSYRTPFLALEMNFGFAFRKQDWTSLSISFLQDRSGVVNLGKGGFMASGAYHIGMGKGDLSIGAQFGGVSLSAKDADKATFSDALASGASSSPDLMKLQQGKADYNDISAGVVYSAPVGSKKHDLKIGFAANHLSQPSVSVSGSGATNKLKMLLTGSASLRYHLNERTDLVPMIWFRNVTKFTETVPQCMLSYLFNAEKKVRLNAGLGYRFGDALQIMAGVDYNKIKVQLGYDMTTSDLSSALNPSGFGAIEIGVLYIGAITKKPDPKPKLFCPRF
jgi:type IX secretion system PorP/SprF family membrane protein